MRGIVVIGMRGTGVIGRRGLGVIGSRGIGVIGRRGIDVISRCDLGVTGKRGPYDSIVNIITVPSFSLQWWIHFQHADKQPSLNRHSIQRQNTL